MFVRIAPDPMVLGGKPTIKGTRISVEMVKERVASGASRDDVLRAYPHLTTKNI